MNFSVLQMTLITDLLSIGARRAIREIPIFSHQDVNGRVHDVGICLSAEPAERLFRLFTGDILVCGQKFSGDFSGKCQVITARGIASQLFPRESGQAKESGSFTDFASAVVDRIMSMVSVLMDEEIKFSLPTAPESFSSMDTVLRESTSSRHSFMLYVCIILETTPRRSPILLAVHIDSTYAKEFIKQVDRLSKISLCA